MGCVRAVLLLTLAACDAVPTLVQPGDDADASLDATVDATPDGDGSLDATPGLVTPSNVEVGALAATGLVLGPPDGTFDTSTDCGASSLLGTCAPVTQLGRELCVCRMDRLVIDDLTVTGARGLVILAWDSVSVIGVLDLGGRAGLDGPGAADGYLMPAAGLAGGAGGSFATRGGNPSAAAVTGSDTLAPLVGGMGGQDACDSAGGGGGGAIQITAGRAIEVTGVITAGGGGGAGGKGGGNCLGAAGGGAGGGVLLEAPTVTVSGTIVAGGGGGGGGGSDDHGGGAPGSDAHVSVDAAGGGAGNDNRGCVLGGYTVGGDGGQGAPALPTARNGGPSDSVTSGCLGVTTFLGEGGGGGGSGRIRINTESGCLCSGTFAPDPSIGDVEIQP